MHCERLSLNPTRGGLNVANPATLFCKPCLFTPLPMPPNLIKDRTLYA